MQRQLSQLLLLAGGAAAAAAARASAVGAPAASRARPEGLWARGRSAFFSPSRANPSQGVRGVSGSTRRSVAEPAERVEEEAAAPAGARAGPGPGSQAAGGGKHDRQPHQAGRKGQQQTEDGRPKQGQGHKQGSQRQGVRPQGAVGKGGLQGGAGGGKAQGGRTPPPRAGGQQAPQRRAAPAFLRAAKEAEQRGDPRPVSRSQQQGRRPGSVGGGADGPSGAQARAPRGGEAPSGGRASRSGEAREGRGPGYGRQQDPSRRERERRAPPPPPPPQAARRPPPPPPPAPKQPTVVVIDERTTVGSLAASLGVSTGEVEGVLQALGLVQPASEAELLGAAEAELVAGELGAEADVRGDASAPEAPESTWEERPPVVAVLGHVDHGKTTLLDALRRTTVAAGEAGGITQRIGAFTVPLPSGDASLTFLDTPGHAAFSAMRARGAAATDVAVLVVAADDGPRPQTREALEQALAAGSSLVVAITKCDVPGADPAAARLGLAGLGVHLESDGGDVPVVEVAAPLGLGLDELEEAVLLAANLRGDLRVPVTGRAAGVAIEARVDRGRGPVATVVVHRGRLEKGQVVVVGSEWGRVRALNDEAGEPREHVLPGRAAEISGLRGLPAAGDQLTVVDSEARAAALCAARTRRAESARHARAAEAVARAEGAFAEVGGEEAARVTAGEAKAAASRPGARGGPERPKPGTTCATTLSSPCVRVIVKGDADGAVGAACDALEALSAPDAPLEVVGRGVGPVSLADVKLAAALGARIVAYGVGAGPADAKKLAKRECVEVMQHRVIYRLLEEAEEWVSGAAPRVPFEKLVGEATVLKLFKVRAAGVASTIAGCSVKEGTLRVEDRTWKLLREPGPGAARGPARAAGAPGGGGAGDAPQAAATEDGLAVVWSGSASELRREKMRVDAVGRGAECGVLLSGSPELRPGDVLRCYETEMIRAADAASRAKKAATKSS